MSADQFTIRLLGPADQDLVHEGSALFDDTPLPEQTADYLASERDHLWFAMDGSRPVGFVSATRLLHPDKRPSLFVNELGVHEDFRRRGIATRLMAAVYAFVQSEGLESVWVAAEGDDDQANAFYKSLSDWGGRPAIVYEREEG